MLVLLPWQTLTSSPHHTRQQRLTKLGDRFKTDLVRSVLEIGDFPLIKRGSQPPRRLEVSAVPSAQRGQARGSLRPPRQALHPPPPRGDVAAATRRWEDGEDLPPAPAGRRVRPQEHRAARGRTRPQSLTAPLLSLPLPGNRRTAGGAFPAASSCPAAAGTGGGHRFRFRLASPRSRTRLGGPFLLKAQGGGAAAIFSEGRGGAGKGGTAGCEMETGPGW